MAERVVEPLVTQCPHCKTRFRVTHAQLTVAGGRVRCGACLAVFTGTEHLIVASETPAAAREDADAALDALLDELRKDEPLPGDRREGVDDVGADLTEDAATEAGPDADVDVEAAGEAARDTESAMSEADDFEAAAADHGAAPAVPEDVAETGSDLVDATEPDRAAGPTVAPHDDSAAIAAANAQLAAANAQLEAANAQLTAANAPLAEGDAPLERDGTAPAPASEETREATPEEAGVETHQVHQEARPVEQPLEAVEAPPASRERALRRTLDLDLGLDPDELVALPRRRRRWLIWPVLLLCLAALAAQVLYLRFDVWAKDPQLRPIYAWLCPRVGCKLPEMRALDKLISKNLVVRADPNVPGALQVDALIINEAPFPQPFPVIELRFSSMGGNLITGRRFRPDEYLAGDLKGAKLMMPMTPVHIALEIDDPGQDAVNYVMVFR